MARNPLALRKGMSAEYLAKAHFSKKGYLIVTPDCHETNYDFLINKEKEQFKVQVKSINTVNNYLARIRNKHGADNKAYKKSDYDILAGIWVERNKIYLFNSDEINETSFGETITVERLDGRKLDNHKRPSPYYEGDI